MDKISFVTETQHRNQTLILQETYLPANYGRMVVRQDQRPQALDTFMAMARDYADDGNLSLEIYSYKHPTHVQVDIIVDVTKNRRRCREADLYAVGNRLGAAFGLNNNNIVQGPNNVDRTLPDEFIDQPYERSLPPPSFVGDLFRAIGNTLGLICDYIAHGIWVLLVGVCNGLRNLIGRSR